MAIITTLFCIIIVSCGGITYADALRKLLTGKNYLQDTQNIPHPQNYNKYSATKQHLQRIIELELQKRVHNNNYITIGNITLNQRNRRFYAGTSPTVFKIVSLDPNSANLIYSGNRFVLIIDTFAPEPCIVAVDAITKELTCSILSSVNIDDDDISDYSNETKYVLSFLHESGLYHIMVLHDRLYALSGCNITKDIPVVCGQDKQTYVPIRKATFMTIEDECSRYTGFPY